MIISARSVLIFFLVFLLSIPAVSQVSKEIEKESFRSYKSKNLTWANKQNADEVEVLYINNYDEGEFPNADILKFKNLKKLVVIARSLVSKYNEEMKDPVKISIDKNKISQLKNLEFLQLSKFDFRVFPNEILNLEKLKSLSLNNCLIKSIPEEISKLKNLNGLFLRQNMLVQLPENFNELSQLKVLDIGNNSLTEIPTSLLKMKDLEIIYLANYNGVKTDPYTWDWPVNLGVNVINYEYECQVLNDLLSLESLKKIHLHVNNSAIKKRVKRKINSKVLAKKIFWQAIDCGCG